MSAHVMDGTAVAARLLEQVTVGTTGFARMESRYVELPASTIHGRTLPWMGSSCSTQSPLMSTSAQPSKRSPDQGCRRGHDAQLAGDAMRT